MTDSNLQNRRLSPAGIAAALAAVLLMIPVPLMMDDGYFNIVETKSRALAAVLALAVLFAAVTAAVTADRRFALKKNAGFGRRVSAVGISGFALSALVSSLLSEDPAASLTGSAGWGIGAFVIAASAVTAFYLARYLPRQLPRKRPLSASRGSWLLIPASAAILPVTLMTLIQAAGIDLFSLHAHIAPQHFFDYLGPLGNVNAHVPWLCLTIPALLVCYLRAEKCRAAVFLFLLELCLLDAVLTGCDGTAAGLGFAAFFAVPLITGSDDSLRRFLAAAGVFGLSLVLVVCLPAYAARRAAASGLMGLFLKPAAALLLIPAGFAGWFLMSSRWDKSGKRQRLFRRIFAAVMTAVLTAAALYFFYDLAVHFSDSWGTSRGLIWRTALERRAQASLKDRLFGIGPERQVVVLSSLRITGLAVKTVHSEALQILLTMGINGLIWWITAWIGVILMWIECRQSARTAMAEPGAGTDDRYPHTDDRCLRTAGMLALLAYLGQSFFNSTTPTGMALLILAYAVCR